jgi:hypothetical protein
LFDNFAEAGLHTWIVAEVSLQLNAGAFILSHRSLYSIGKKQVSFEVDSDDHFWAAFYID